MLIGWIRSFRRRRFRKQPFPAHWRGILEERAPFVERIPASQVSKFELDLMVFEHEKEFVGAGGLEVTEEMRVVISAAAVRLILFLEIGLFDRTSEIVVYPGAYHHPESDAVILGEVSPWSNVVLSWEDVLAGLQNPHDGLDTATHEFAHVLDRDSGAFNGTPILRAREDYGPWGRILSEHFLRMQTRKGRRKGSVLREYAATNEAEFFAVATEVFFERPRVMKKRAPDLYREFERFYGVDPAESAVQAES